MKRSTQNVKLALAAAVVASSLVPALTAEAGSYLTVELFARKTGTLDPFSSTITPTALDRYDFQIAVTLAPAGTTNAFAAPGFTSIQSWIPSAASSDISQGDAAAKQVSGLSSMVFSIYQPNVAGQIATHFSGLNPPGKDSYSSGNSLYENYNTWLSGSGANAGARTLRSGTTLNDYVGAVLVRATGASAALYVPPGGPTQPVVDENNGSWRNWGFAGIADNSSPITDMIVGTGNFRIDSLGTSTTLRIDNLLGFGTSQLLAGIRWKNGGADVNYSIPADAQAASVSGGDPLINYVGLTLVGSTTASITGAVIVATPGTGASRLTGETVQVANNATAGNDPAVLSNIAVSTSAATSANGSWGQSGLSTADINPGANQLGTVTVTPAANILKGAKITGTLSFDAAGKTIPAVSGAGPYSYNLNHTIATNTAPYAVAQTAGVASGDTLAGLATTGDGTTNGDTLTIVDSSVLASDASVSVTWRARNANESFPGGTTPPLPAGIRSLITDVANVDLTATNLPTAYVVQMSYNDAVLGGDDAFAFAAGKLFLANLVGPQWENAGNEGSIAGVNRAYLASDLATIGSWGVDTTNNVAWAVLPGTTEGQFAVVPEPASLGLLALGALGLIRRRK